MVQIRLIGLVTCFGLAACGNPTDVSPDAPLDFELVSVNGAAVPGAALGGLEVTAGSLTLVADGTCSKLVVASPDPGGLTLPCTWERSGVDFVLTWPSSAVDTARVSGEALRLEFSTGVVCVTTPCPSEWTEVYRRVSPR
jgi:hypothetical protein